MLWMVRRRVCSSLVGQGDIRSRARSFPTPSRFTVPGQSVPTSCFRRTSGLSASSERRTSHSAVALGNLLELEKRVQRYLPCSDVMDMLRYRDSHGYKCLTSAPGNYDMLDVLDPGLQTRRTDIPARAGRLPILGGRASSCGRGTWVDRSSARDRHCSPSWGGGRRRLRMRKHVSEWPNCPSCT